MHVLHVFIEINFSGAETMYANAAPLFQQQGIKMTALSTGKNRGNYTQQFEQAGIPIFHKPLPGKNPVSFIRYYRNMYAFFKKEKIEVLHMHRPDVFWFFSLCASLAGIKTIVTAHNVFKNRAFTLPKSRLERMTARKFFRVTFQTIGESVYNNELNYYKNPSVRVNNWYDAKKFFPATDAAEKERTRNNLEINQTDFVIVSTGSCSAVKNHAAIIESLSIVTKQISCTYLHLGSGLQEKEEKESACALQVQENIRFLGNKVNVRDYLIAADVFVMPSKYEGLSIAAIEAMGCGLPCILYNSPGLVDLIKADDNGFLIDHDYTLIAEKILAFRNNPALTIEKGQNAYKFASNHFNMQNGVTEIIRLYRTN